MLVEHAMAETVAKLWPGVALRAQSCPVQWEDIALARRFLQGFFVRMFDHNSARVGVICPFLAWSHARQALDLQQCRPTLPNFVWSGEDTLASAVERTRCIPNLPAHLFSCPSGRPPE